MTISLDDTVAIIDDAFRSAGLTDTQRDSMTAEADERGLLDPFLEKILAGESPRMALMLVLQSPPGTKGTDAVFNNLERQRVQSHYSDEHMQKIHAIARKSGIDTAGKTYQGQLGKYNDPMAWVSGTHDVRATAKAKGMAISGQVNVDYLPTEFPHKAPALSERAIRDMESKYFERDPGLQAKVSRDQRAKASLREKIIRRHGAKTT